MRFAAALALVAMPAIACAGEATLDGVTFAIPQGSEFYVPPPHAGKVEPGALQAAVDRNRSEGPTREAANLLFTSTREKGKPVLVVAVREPGSGPAAERARKAVEEARFDDGVAVLSPLTLYGRETDRTGYAVRTGLDFAPEALVTCGRASADKGTCDVVAKVGERLRVGVHELPVASASPAAVRDAAVSALRDALPRGAR